MKVSNYYPKDCFSKLLAEAQQKGFQSLQDNKIHHLCLHNLISNTLELMQIYNRLKSPSQIFSSWIIDYYTNKYQKKSSCNRAFFTHIMSWRKHLETSGELRLCLTFLTKERGRQQVLKHFLKIRKQIIKGRIAILDQITLTHQQIIAILHRLYHQSQRRIILKKLNDCYLIQQQKPISLILQSTVLCQFLISQVEQIQAKGQQFKITKQNRMQQKFNSQVHINNGIVSNKKHRSPETSRGMTKRTINSNQSNSNSRFYRSKEKNRQSSRVFARIKMSENSLEPFQQSSYLNKMNHGYEDDSQFSPGRVFRIEEDNDDSENDNGHEDGDDNQNDNGFYPQQLDEPTDTKRSNMFNGGKSKISIASYITQKYSEDWERMLQINQDFKNRVLQKTKQQLDSIYGTTYQQQQPAYYCIQQQDEFSYKLKQRRDNKQSERKRERQRGREKDFFKLIEVENSNRLEKYGFSFQDEEEESEIHAIPEIRQSTPKMTKNFST